MRAPLPRVVIGLLCWVGIMVTPSRVAADTINFMGTGKSAVVTIESPSLGRLNVRAGELNWSSVTGDELADLFFAYCVDPNNWLTSTQLVSLASTDDLGVPGVPDAGGKAAWLVNTYAPRIHRSGSGTDAAALQVAIWAAMFNNSGTLSDGPFKLYTPGPIEIQARIYLDSLFSGPSGYQTSRTTWLNGMTGQDQILPAPEPGTLLLMGTGLALAYRAARRRR